MKLGIALVLVFVFGAGQVVRAQAAPPSQNKPQQNVPAKTQKPVDSANPFPEDTNNVPVMPRRERARRGERPVQRGSRGSAGRGCGPGAQPR